MIAIYCLIFFSVINTLNVLVLHVSVCECAFMFECVRAVYTRVHSHISMGVLSLFP